MASISAATTHKVVKKTTAKAPVKTGILKSGASAKLKANGSAAPARRGSVAPKLKASELNHPDSLAKFLALSEAEQKDRIVNEFLAHCFGERATFHEGIAKPHTASTTQSRGAAAADIAILVKSLGPIVVLKRFEVLSEVEKTLLPQGIGEFYFSVLFVLSRSHVANSLIFPLLYGKAHCLEMGQEKETIQEEE